jgi:hypothetical protein
MYLELICYINKLDLSFVMLFDIESCSIRILCCYNGTIINTHSDIEIISF